MSVDEYYEDDEPDDPDDVCMHGVPWDEVCWQCDDGDADYVFMSKGLF